MARQQQKKRPAADFRPGAARPTPQTEEECLLEAAYRSALGDERLAQDDLMGAIDAYRQAAEYDGNNVEHRLRLADAYLFAEQPLAAYHEYQKLLRQTPTCPEALLGLAEVYRQAGRYESELAAYRRASTLAADRAYFHYLLAEAFLRRGLVNDAEAELQVALTLEPNEGFYHFRLAELYLREQRSEPALAALERAVECTPWDDYYHAYLGAAYAQQRRWREAVLLFKKALEIRPQQRCHYAMLSEVYQSLGLLEKADQCRRQAGQLDAYDRDYIRRLWEGARGNHQGTRPSIE
jgi:tetratricopeptide (TPR) repeat protein